MYVSLTLCATIAEFLAIPSFKSIYPFQDGYSQASWPNYAENDAVESFDYPHKITVVTAASANHYCALKSFLMTMNALKHNSSGESLYTDVLKMPREGLPIPQRPPDWDDATMDDIRMAYGVPPKKSRQRPGRRVKRQLEDGHTHQAQETLIDRDRPVPDFSIIVYDLGFLPEQRESLVQLQQQGFFDQLRRFRFEAYPSFFDIETNRGEYAWKPALIKEVWDDIKRQDYTKDLDKRDHTKDLDTRDHTEALNKRDHITPKHGKMPVYKHKKDYSDVPVLLWMDTGDMVSPKFMQDIQKLVATNGGFYSPRSSGTLATLTHPDIYPALSIDDASPYQDYANCNGALAAFSPAFEPVHKLMDDWWDCAAKKSCIAPEGSNRMNHRQDQSALTIIAARDGFFCSRSPQDYGGRVHMDVHCTGIVRAYLDRWNEWDVRSSVAQVDTETYSENSSDTPPSSPVSPEQLHARLNAEYEQENQEVSFRLWRWKVRADFRKKLAAAAAKKAKDEAIDVVSASI